MKTTLKIIDSISEWTGRTACWLALVLVGLISFEVVMRYVFNSPSVWSYETQLFVGGTLYALSWSYAQRHDSQIRIDIIYSRLSPRVKAGINTFGTLFLFLPILGVFSYGAVARTIMSWRTGEIADWFFWFPPMAPFRTAVAIGFLLFAFQGLANLVRDSYFLVRNKEL